MDKIFRLVYISEADININYSDLENILYSSNLNNKKSGITGVLIHKNDFFIQLLEGSENNVKELLAVIIKDRRHKNLQILKEWASTEPRYFDKWSMSFLDSDLLEQTHPLIQQLITDTLLVDLPQVADYQTFFSSISNQQSYTA